MWLIFIGIVIRRMPKTTRTALSETIYMWHKLRVIKISKLVDVNLVVEIKKSPINGIDKQRKTKINREKGVKGES